MTVAVLDEISKTHYELQDCDLEESYYRGSGPGGQHRNKTDTAVRIKHIPTGLVVTSEESKSQYQNRQLAKQRLVNKLEELSHEQWITDINSTRLDQTGCGDRMSVDWSWCDWRDEVICNKNGKKQLMSKALKGKIKL